MSTYTRTHRINLRLNDSEMEEVNAIIEAESPAWRKMDACEALRVAIHHTAEKLPMQAAISLGDGRVGGPKAPKSNRPKKRRKAALVR